MLQLIKLSWEGCLGKESADVSSPNQKPVTYLAGKIPALQIYDSIHDDLRNADRQYHHPMSRSLQNSVHRKAYETQMTC